jgi:tetratricopeptide (TPR) repeat protein
MAFKAAKCPNCAGELQVPDERNTVKCMYCGSDIIVREAIKAAAAGVNVENLFNLAKSAFETGNYQEAFDYYTRVLEVDAQNYEAWLGKGLSAGWMSTLASFRFPEMINGVDKAIEYAPDNLKEKIKWEAACDIQNIVNACKNIATNYRIENGWSSEKVVTELIFQHRKLIEALEYALNLAPAHMLIITDILFLCKGIIEDGIEMGASDAWSKDIREKLDSYISKQKLLDPSFSFDVPETKKASTDSKCFVATATMGDRDHPVVVLLREFRDAWLLERKYGPIFIKFYHKISPYLAMIINKNRCLKRISYALIIRPAVYIAGLLLKRKHLI